MAPTVPAPFDIPRLRDALKPIRLHWFPTLRSTNDHAALLRERGTLFAPAVVLTGRQTAGRGRGAHRWWSPAGCLTVTLVLPADDAVAPHEVPLLAGLAVRRAAEGLLERARVSGDGALKRAEESNGPTRAKQARSTPPLPDGRSSFIQGVQLKWPNDLQHAGRKLAGLLCERVLKADLIGIGLNVNVDPADAPADLREKLTSLAAVAGRPLDLTDALVAVVDEVRRIMRERAEVPFAMLLAEYDQHHALVGRRVSVTDAGDGQAISGKCEGLDEMGRLLVRGRAQLHRVIAGQVVAT